MDGKILIVDDNEDVLFALNLLLEPYVEKIKVTTSPARIEYFMDNFNPDIILLDMNFSRDASSGQEGLDWLAKILQKDPQAVVLFITAYADTENMKKRLQKDADATRKYRFQQPATEILPILDSMEMALKVQTEDEAIKNYVKGFEMIHKQLKGVLEKEGVQEIDAADKPFDHNTMQALMQEKKEGVESGMVIEVLQKGYMLKDRILRPALVKVSE